MQDAIAINPELTVATFQVTPKQLRQAAQIGFQSVLNLRVLNEPGVLLDEQAQATAAGLYYKNTPINPAALDDAKVAQVLQQIEHLPKPALLHCGSGVRAGLMASLYIAKQQRLTAEQTIAMAQALGMEWPTQPTFKQICESVCN